MYSLVEQEYNKYLRNRKKNLKKNLRRFRYYNWKEFYRFFNYHTQQRSGYDITRFYLINSRKWYFQKKKNLFFKSNKYELKSFTCDKIMYKKIKSKINWLY